MICTPRKVELEVDLELDADEVLYCLRAGHGMEELIIQFERPPSGLSSWKGGQGHHEFLDLKSLVLNQEELHHLSEHIHGRP